jgi:poly(3-hydroxybutyrate) depolymerase
LLLAACGGGSGDAGDERAEPLAVKTQKRATSPVTAAGSTVNTLEAGITIAGFPHKIDVYRPAGATRAIVFLHGHGGRAGQLAYNLGFNRTGAVPTAQNVNWDWLSRNGIIAVFPQGQAAPGSTMPTWNNYFFDSGQDDVAFLKALSSHLKLAYAATEVSLAGHSSGGVMTARVWCEATGSYKAYVSMAGPMASPSSPGPGPTCTPLASAPYYIIVGGKDTTLPKFSLGLVAPTPEQLAAGLTDSILVGEWMRHQDRSRAVCGETPLLESNSNTGTGPTWNACDARIRYTVVTNADHAIASLEQYAGIKMVDAIAAFVD